MALFSTPDYSHIIWAPQQWPEDSGGVGSFMSGMMGGMGVGGMTGGGTPKPSKAPKGTTTTGGAGGKSYAPGMSGYGGKTGGTPGSGTVKGGGIDLSAFKGLFGGNKEEGTEQAGSSESNQFAPVPAVIPTQHPSLASASPSTSLTSPVAVQPQSSQGGGYDVNALPTLIDRLINSRMGSGLF